MFEKLLIKQISNQEKTLDKWLNKHDKENPFPNDKVKMYEITNKGLKMLDSLKQFMHKKRPENNMLISFFDDMLFNDNMFIKK